MTHNRTENGAFRLDDIKTNLESYGFQKSTANTKITKVSAALSLESQTAIDVWLTVQDDAELTATATLNGKTFSAQKQSDGRYRLRIEGVLAQQLSETIHVSGTCDGSFTLDVSGLAYVKAALNSDAFSSDCHNAMAALYNYYKAAADYKS